MGVSQCFTFMVLKIGWVGKVFKFIRSCKAVVCLKNSSSTCSNLCQNHCELVDLIPFADSLESRALLSVENVFAILLLQNLLGPVFLWTLCI